MSEMTSSIPLSAQLKETLGDLKGAAKDINNNLRDAQRELRALEKEKDRARRKGEETASLDAKSNPLRKRIEQLDRKHAALIDQIDKQKFARGESEKNLFSALQRMNDKLATAGRVAHGRVGFGDAEQAGERLAEYGSAMFKAAPRAGLAIARLGKYISTRAAFLGAAVGAVGVIGGGANRLITQYADDNYGYADARNRRGDIEERQRARERALYSESAAGPDEQRAEARRLSAAGTHGRLQYARNHSVRTWMGLGDAGAEEAENRARETQAMLEDLNTRYSLNDGERAKLDHRKLSNKKELQRQVQLDIGYKENAIYDSGVAIKQAIAEAIGGETADEKLEKKVQETLQKEASAIQRTRAERDRKTPEQRMNMQNQSLLRSNLNSDRLARVSSYAAY